MRKLIPLLACLLALLGLGVLVVQNTKAEATSTSVPSVSEGTQGSESARTGAPGGLNGVSQLGASSTPTTCIAYTYTLSSFDLPVVTATPGAMETTASVVDNSAPSNLPFAFTFYGVSYTSVNILNFGNLQFTTSNDSPHSCPFPFLQLGPSILPYWSEFDLHWGGSGDGPCVQNYGIPCGIYESTTGIAPYRIYTVQWVGVLYGSNHETVNFSARLYETTNVIDFVYDYGIMFGDYAAVGVQDGLGRYTAYTCNMSAQLQGRVIRWTPVITNECATDTPTPTPTITLTPTPTQTCPTSWVAAPSPTWSGTGSDQLTGVDALGSNDVWAVGSTSGTSGMVQHWDGTQWNPVPDDPPGFSETLAAVSALSANDIWIVGSYNYGSLGGTLTEHWDGTQWTHVQSPNGGNNEWAGLSSVSALATDDVWAVGTTDRLVYGGGTPLILHWNGTYWALISSQTLQGNLYLRSVSAIAPDDVWAVGTYLVGSTLESEVAHWDGTAWSPSPIPTFGGTFSLYGVVAIDANDVWAVGYTWSQTLTMHWDGSVWSVVPSPNIGNGGNRLYAVDALASDNVWAVGSYAPDGMSDRTLTMRWDGAAWTIVSSPSPSPRSYYQSVSVLPSGEGWTVGYNMVPSTTFSIVARYVPSEVCGTFTPSPTGTPTNTPTTTAIVTQTPGTATPTSTMTTTSTTATPTATATSCTINFSDVHTTDYFYEPVRYLYCAGVITGYPDNTFRPYNNASRGQLSKIVVLAEGMPINITGAPHFNDVLLGNPFYDYIETAYNAGLINGYADGSFRWSNDVTRGQICKIVVNAEGWTIDTSGGPHFPDVEPGSTFYDFIETAYHHALINGYPDGTFGPGNPATRGQIAKIVHNAVVGP